MNSPLQLTAYGITFKGERSDGSSWFNIAAYNAALEKFKEEIADAVFPCQATSFQELFHAMAHHQRIWETAKILGQNAVKLYAEELELATYLSAKK